MSYGINYLKYRWFRSVNDSLQKLSNLQESDNETFIENSKKIERLLRENEYIIENYRTRKGYKNVLQISENDKYYIELIKKYCKENLITFDNLLNNRQSQYSIHRFAWFHILSELGVGTVRIGNIFNKTHSTISAGRRNRNMKYDNQLKRKYLEIKEFIAKEKPDLINRA